MPEVALPTSEEPLKSFNINDLRVFLEGTWKLERRLDDRLGGDEGRLVGEARFAPRGDSLAYGEEGLLTLGDHSGPAHQAYRYDFPAPGRAAVHFADGRFFHDLDLRRGLWHCTHLCGADRYDGEFAALGPDTLRVVWRVAGPRKDLTLDSTYRRAL